MERNSDQSTFHIGEKELAFEHRKILNRFLIQIPCSFQEDTTIKSSYSYFFSVDKSPLGVTFKYVEAQSPAHSQMVIANYFGKEAYTGGVKHQGSRIVYGSFVTEGRYASIYSLRFVVNTNGGLVMGCFNCNHTYAADWESTILQILEEMRPVDTQ